MSIRSGLVSISFRKLSVEAIIAAVAKARLDGIEWGGDVHVPQGDLAVAGAVGAMTRDAGLQVAAYGSYYRVGVSEAQNLPFEKVLASALALQTRTIRVWAGSQGSEATPIADRERIIDDARRIAAMAAAQRVTVAFEYHRGTLTDTRASARDLLQATRPAGLAAYWQPSVGWSHEEHLASLRDMLPYLANLHVFQWDATGKREELASGQSNWVDFLALLRTHAPTLPPQPRWAMLEFVKDDTLDQFMRDAAVLRRLLNVQD